MRVFIFIYTRAWTTLAYENGGDSHQIFSTFEDQLWRGWIFFKISKEELYHTSWGILLLVKVQSYIVTGNYWIFRYFIYAASWIEFSFLRLSTCMCECMCVYIYICVCIYIYICVCVCVCVYIYIYIYIYICMYVCMYACMYVCAYVRSCARIYVCILNWPLHQWRFSGLNWKQPHYEIR